MSVFLTEVHPTDKASDTQPRVQGNLQRRKPHMKDTTAPTKYVLASGHTPLKHSKKGFKHGSSQTKTDRQNVPTNRSHTQSPQRRVKKQPGIQQKQKQTTNRQSTWISKKKINRPQTQPMPPQQDATHTNKQQNKKNPVWRQQNAPAVQPQLKKEKQTLYRQPKQTEPHRRYHPAAEKEQSQAKRAQHKQHKPLSDRKIPKHRMKRPLHPGRRGRR